MKVALVGATGAVGSRLLTELVARGHEVTAMARHVDAIAPMPLVTPLKVNVLDVAELTDALAGHDAVITAVGFRASDPALLIRAVREAGVRRYLVVGGAGSLDAAPGVRLYDTPEFPDAWREEARAGGAFLDMLRKVTDLDWTFVSPSALLEPGVRTGRFRIGGDQLLVDADGKSHISMEDLAVAMIDELEHPAHLRRRITVGY